MKIRGMFGAKSRSGSRIFVKICGITNEPDALAAIEAGTDALGFNLVPQSKRYIDIDAAAGWIDKLPRETCKVAVMADPDLENGLRISRLRFISALQLHGSESPELCRRLNEAGVQFAKAVPVAHSKSLVDVPDFFTDTLILDSTSGADFGGTGKAFPWKFAGQFVRAHPKLNVILAGGLSAENVVEAISEVHPCGVDVTSGVEIAPGRKDHRQIQAFIKAARRAAV